jgi:thymidylate synthase
MIQEMMARRLGVELGDYYQYVGSMHVYEDCLGDMRGYVQEGIQQTIEMPPMPDEDPFTLIKNLLGIESRLRAGKTVHAATETTEPYWADIIRLLQVFWAREWAKDYCQRLEELREELVSHSYRTYVDGRKHLKSRAQGQ